MTEILVYPDGTTCDPFAEDCPVPKDDDQIGILIENGVPAAVVYGLFAFLAALLPPIAWSNKKTVLNALTSNNYYQYAWIGIRLGHLALYAFPALGAGISFAALPRFTPIYVLW